jgi:hypothetical protein
METIDLKEIKKLVIEHLANISTEQLEEELRLAGLGSQQSLSPFSLYRPTWYAFACLDKALPGMIASTDVESTSVSTGYVSCTGTASVFTGSTVCISEPFLLLGTNFVTGTGPALAPTEEKAKKTWGATWGTDFYQKADNNTVALPYKKEAA